MHAKLVSDNEVFRWCKTMCLGHAGGAQRPRVITPMTVPAAVFALVVSGGGSSLLCLGAPQLARIKTRLAGMTRLIGLSFPCL